MMFANPRRVGLLVFVLSSLSIQHTCKAALKCVYRPKHHSKPIKINKLASQLPSTQCVHTASHSHKTCLSEGLKYILFGVWRGPSRPSPRRVRRVRLRVASVASVSASRPSRPSPRRVRRVRRRASWADRPGGLWEDWGGGLIRPGRTGEDWPGPSGLPLLPQGVSSDPGRLGEASSDLGGLGSFNMNAIHVEKSLGGLGGGLIRPGRSGGAGGSHLGSWVNQDDSP